MLNAALDLAGYQKDLSEKGYVRIENILDRAYAERIEAALRADVSWELCYLTGSGPKSIPHSEYQAYNPTQAAAINRDILNKAQSGFAYFYYRTDLVSGGSGVLSEFYNKLSDRRCLDIFRDITGEPKIEAVNGQAACFGPACFLKRHQDTTDKEKRLFAYVFSFTRGWDPDWGGHLHILDKEFRNLDVFEPSFNTLTIFRVPQAHFVSQVSNYARGARYTVTGWMLG